LAAGPLPSLPPGEVDRGFGARAGFELVEVGGVRLWECPRFISGTGCHDQRVLAEGPLALRHRLSPGLPFREASWWEPNTKEQLTLAGQRGLIGPDPRFVERFLVGILDGCGRRDGTGRSDRTRMRPMAAAA